MGCGSGHTVGALVLWGRPASLSPRDPRQPESKMAAGSQRVHAGRDRRARAGSTLVGLRSPSLRQWSGSARRPGRAAQGAPAVESRSRRAPQGSAAAARRRWLHRCSPGPGRRSPQAYSIPNARRALPTSWGSSSTGRKRSPTRDRRSPSDSRFRSPGFRRGSSSQATGAETGAPGRGRRQ